MEMKFGTVAMLWKEKEYGEALLENLTMRYHWVFILTDEMDENVYNADLILAEEGWFDEIRERDELWNKTVFLMEHQPLEDPLTRDEFPYLVWKYDGFSKLRRRIGEAMEVLCDQEYKTEVDMPPMIVLGAWDEDEEECREIAEELSGKLERNILFMSVDRFAGAKRESVYPEDCSLEDLLYYALERMELEGISPCLSIRGALKIRNGACYLPDCCGANPLTRLDDEQWNALMKMLCNAAEPAAILVWTGRESIDQCRRFRGQIRECFYVRPEKPEERNKKRWERLSNWMERDGEAMLHTRIQMADSWTQMFGMVMEFGTELE